MKRKRVEDLGIIKEKMRKMLDVDSIFDDCKSKHTVDCFIGKYKENQDGLIDLHNWIKNLNEELYFIYAVACGYEDEK